MNALLLSNQSPFSDEPQANTSTLSNGTARSRELARRKQSVTPSTSSAASSSTNNPNSRTNSVTLDHNYGEPGPSSLRNTRRAPTLSRHQRNPAELDLPAVELSTTPAEDPLRLPERVTRRRGLDAAPAVNAITSSTGRRRNLVNYGENEDDDDEEEEDETNEVEANEEESDDEQEEASADSAADEELDEDEASDPDDDKPLGRLMASSESQKSQRHRPTRSGGDIDNGSVEAGPSSRSARAVKRNYAEDESDDESTGRRVVLTQSLKRRRLQSQTEHERTPFKGKARGQTRTPNGSTSHYNTRHHGEADDGSDLEPNGEDEVDAEPQISRYGRVCKVSNRVKGYLRE